MTYYVSSGTDLPKTWRDRRESENGPSACPFCQSHRQVFSIGTVAAYSSKYSALVEYKIRKLFQY